MKIVKMTLRKKILFIIIIVLVAGCGSRKAASPEGKNPYERPPLREVNEAQLKTDGRLIDALALQMSDRHAEAFEAYARIVRDDPTCAAAWYEMGRQLTGRRWSDSAEHCLQRAVKLQPDNVWYLKALAQNESQSGNLKALTQTWERIVKVQPTVLENYYELSNAYIEASDLPKAVEALDRVERMIGVREEVSLQKQRIWNAAGKPDKALKEVEALADAYPGETRYNAILAQHYMQQKNYRKAKTYYDRIAKQNPNDPYIHIQLAEYYMAVGNSEEMDKELLQAYANPGLDSRSKLQMLGTFYKEDDFYGPRSQTTFRLMDLAMQGCEDSTEFAAFYGDVLRRQGKAREAAHQFMLALQRDSSQYELWEVTLVCLYEVEGAEETLADYAARAARLFPMHTMPHYLLAMHDYNNKHYDEALGHLDDAMKWGFTKGFLEADCYGLAAECHYEAGHYDKAWTYYDRCLAVHPDDWMTANNYAYHLALQGVNLEKALDLSRRSIEAYPSMASYLDTYAWILHLLGRDKEALPYMKKAIELDSASDTLQEHYQTIKNSLP